MKTIEDATKENFISARLMSDMRLKTIENAFTKRINEAQPHVSLFSDCK